MKRLALVAGLMFCVGICGTANATLITQEIEIAIGAAPHQGDGTITGFPELHNSAGSPPSVLQWSLELIGWKNGASNAPVKAQTASSLFGPVQLLAYLGAPIVWSSGDDIFGRLSTWARFDGVPRTLSVLDTEFANLDVVDGGTLTFELAARISAIPEPTTLALMALGVAGLGYSRRKGQAV